jgi:hypothetical protein
MNIDTVVVKGAFKGNQTSSLGWTVSKNNTISTFSTQLYFIGRDTINYTIEY